MKYLLQFNRFMVMLVAMLTLSLTSVMANDTITVNYGDTFDPALPTSGGNTDATAHVDKSTGAKSFAFKEKGIYKGSTTNYLMFVQNKGYLYNTSSLGTIVKVSVTYSSGTSTSAKAGVYFGKSEVSTYTITSNATIKGQSKTDEWTNSTSGNGFFQLSTSNKNTQITKIEIIYSTGGGSDPSLSLSPTSIDFGSVEKNKSVDAQSVTATLTNTTHAAATLSGTNADAFEITAGDELTKTGTITVQPTAATLGAVGTYSASLDVTADGVSGTKSATISLTVTEPAAPTGTFTKYTAASLVEGDYVICDGTNAMNNVVESKRLKYAAVTVSSNQIKDPDAAVIWHIAPSLTEGYWTMYNNAVESYAAFTSSNGNAALITSLTDYGLWQFSGDEFTNKGKTEKYLRKNGTYGFASYGSSTGNKLTLYAKLASYAVSKADNIEYGDIDAQVNSTSVIDQNVTVGTTVTLSNDPEDKYTLAAYSVYKTGDAETTVDVKDGKFTMPAYAVTVSATFAKGIPTPELGLASGTYDGEQKIMISNFDSEYDYFYTTDGSDPAADAELEPTGTSKKYSNVDGIQISSSCTVKVIAYDEENNPSAIATYTYTINPIYTSLADFITAAPTSDRKLMLDEDDDVVIIGKTSKNLYVQDAAGSTIVLYNSTAAPNWAVGKRIEGTLTGTYSEYNSLHQMTLTAYNEASADNDGAMPTPVVLTEFTADNFAANKGKLIKIEDVFFQAESISSNQVIAKNANDKSFVIYNTFGTMTSKTLPLKEDAADATGVYIAYNTTYELAVTAIDAGDAKIDVDPIGGADEASAVGIAPGGSVTITPISGFTTKVDDVTKTAITTVPVTEPTSIAIEATRDFYTTKSVTYFYKVNENIKAVTVNQPAEGGTIAADPTSAAVGATVGLSYNAASHYTFGAFTVMAGETPVTVNETAGVYTFEMPNSDVTVTATFTENAKATATFAKGAEAATGEAPADIEWYVDEKFELPANTFSYTGYKFAGWSDGTSTYAAKDSCVMPEGGVTLTATWEQLSKWAYTYTSNVTGIGTSNKVKIAGTDYNANKQNKGASTSVTVPAGSTELHFHALAWKGEAQTITVAGSLPFAIVADDGVSGSGSTYTLTVDPSQVAYFSIALNNIEKDSVITFQAANNKRFVLFGVNAVKPAAMEIDPTSYDFGSVKEDASADKVFTITPNAFVGGALSASFEGADAAKFSAEVDGNNVTVTFTPGEIRENMAATLKVSATNAVVTAYLSGTGIAAVTPEIVVPAEPVDFGKVKQDSAVADKQITVTLNYLDEATASISGSTFFINKTALVAGENTITISANTAVMGEVADTITITGAGAETKKIAFKMDVLSKWADIYTSNVGDDVLSDEVVIGGENYDAIKKGTGTVSQSAVISVPKGTQTLHFHAAAWNNESTVLVVKQGDTKLGSFELYKDAGVKSSSPFTLKGDNYSTEQYFHVSVAAYTATDAADITFTTSASPYRFVLYGVNQEGGIVPVLDRIEIGGNATKTEYEVGDEFDPAGLTVSAIYKLEGVDRPAVVVTDDVEWSFEPATLTAGEYNVTATATYETKQDSKDVAVVVTAPTPTISVSKSAVGFGMVAKDAVVADQTVAVTLKAIASATVELTGDGASAFTVTPASLTEDGDITISASSATIGDFAATITISATGAESKTIALSISVGANPDVIVASDLAATGTQYTDFSNVVKESGTTYAGNSAKDNSGNIQLRSKDASGIVSTATIGYLKAIDASDVSTATRTLQVYGKNTTYTAASDLYDNATKGKLLGTFTNGGAFVLEEGINLSDYKYIGLRSQSGAMQLSSISIAWTPATFYAVTLTQTDNGTIATSTDAAAEGETVTLTATPATDYAVASWTGLPEGATVSEDKKKVTFTMPAKAVTVSATFELPLTPARSGLSVGAYGTFCSKKKVANYTGATFYQVDYIDKAASTLYFNEVEEGDTLIAGKAYLFKATASEIKVATCGAEVGDPISGDDARGFIGVFEDTQVTAANTWYGIYGNKIQPVAVGVNILAGRAYIAINELKEESYVPQGAPVRRLAFGTPKGAATGLDALFMQEGIQKMMINGQLIIIRDGKMFNAQGQIVK